MATIKNPALKYYGGKFRLAQWIINHFPTHVHYVEPFGGGASVLLQKEPAHLETYNDLDGDVVNFFRVLRHETDELVRRLRLTPWARSEYAMEDARRFFVRLWMSRHAGTLATKAAWRRGKDFKSPMKYLRPENLYAVADRLWDVQIENRDALKLVAEMDSPKTLFYVDPPYPASTRTDKNRYAFEMASDKEHQCLGVLLETLKGHVVLSGYQCDLYRELFEDKGWRRIDRQTMANGGVKRVESLWLAPRTASALGV
jgi:DNA adenine methylase